MSLTANTPSVSGDGQLTESMLLSDSKLGSCGLDWVHLLGWARRLD